MSVKAGRVTFDSTAKRISGYSRQRKSKSAVQATAIMWVVAAANWKAGDRITMGFYVSLVEPNAPRPVKYAG